MVANLDLKRPPGRPRGFDPDAALDRAIELFWSEGYEGVDVDRIARAAGVTKPSLYRVFGGKSSLFVHAVNRYVQTVSALPIAAFQAEPDLADAVRALLQGAVKAATTPGRPRGCLMTCAAATEAARSETVREVLARGLRMLEEILQRRFDDEIADGRLSPTTPARARSRLTVDVMQGLTLRARAGVAREELLRDAASYVPLILGRCP
jgi:AcrR family transcriptional regulator